MSTSRAQLRRLACGGPGWWSAWRLLLLPARSALVVLGWTVSGRAGPLGGVDLVVGAHDLAALLGGDRGAVGVAQLVGRGGAPAGGDAGEQDRGEVADRGVVVASGVDQ